MVCAFAWNAALLLSANATVSLVEVWLVFHDISVWLVQSFSTPGGISL